MQKKTEVVSFRGVHITVIHIKVGPIWHEFVDLNIHLKDILFVRFLSENWNLCY